jgi:class 3 adenylate cyclase/predicted Ser/Thr protein kinase
MSEADRGSEPRAEQGQAIEAERPDALVGQQVDQRYRVEALLATGGMGSVYRAEQIFIGRKVALKVLHPLYQASSEIVERFRREAQLAVQLKAKNVVEVLDFGRTSDGRFYLAMELLEGESLQDVLAREGRLAPARAVALLRQLLEGLEAVHAAGVVHRDLKPENLWLVPTPGGEQLKIIDFGIAKLTELPGGTSRTQVGLVMGTPEYIAPEQAAGKPVDARADLYAVGLIAWIALCGRHPFPTADLQALMRAQAFAKVPRITEASPELGACPRLVEAIERATAKSPAERIASAAELRALLEGAEVASLIQVVARPGLGQRELDLVRPTVVRGGPAKGAHARESRALLFTEVAEFDERAVRLTRRQVARLLWVRDRLFSRALLAFRGRRAKSATAARALAHFRSPGDAIRCAMALHDLLARHSARAPESERIAARAAIHVGEVGFEGGEILGEAASFAARVAGEAAPGEVWLTAAAHVGGSGGDAPIEDLGDWPLKGLAEPVRLFRVRTKSGPLPFGGELLGLADRSALSRLWHGLREGAAAQRRGIAASALAASIGLAAGALVIRSPVAQARRALAAGKPRDGLELLASEKRSPEVLLLRAQAHHALQQFDPEMASFVELSRLSPAQMRREELLAHLVQHLGGPASGRAQEVLALIGEPSIDPLAKAAVDRNAHRRWAALEVLRGLGAEKRADLVAAYIQDLDQRECGVVVRAAKKLAELGDPRAVAPLRAVALRKSTGLFGNVSEACEAPAAKAALRKLGEGR